MQQTEALTELQQMEIQEELHRLVESPAFRNSKRCREFLQHIVEKTLSGPNGSLKERSIGIELFGLPHDFDTSQHTIVRVTASETRKKLALYYQTEVASNPLVQIDLPPGSYNAEFSFSEQAEEVHAPPPETVDRVVESLVVEPPPLQLSRRNLVLGSAAGLLLVGGVSAWTLRSSKPTSKGEPSKPVKNIPTGLATTPFDAVRIGVGLTTPYVDRNGRTWGADQFFTGGTVLSRTSERIVRTLDPDLYRHPRVGEFRYDIPLSKGNFEMHLHFAETGLSDFISAESSGEGQRVFRISVNGKTLLDFFDVVADAAGANTADERVFRDISPAEDGLLHLSFSSLRGSAMLSGIELAPMNKGKVSPLRIRSGWPTSWKDAAGGEWRSDTYFLGGNALVRRTNPARDAEPAAPDNALYASERWGHFSYALPVAPGSYKVTLKFCEGHLGPRNTGAGGVGGRVFDVHCNGVALLKDFDIVREAGGEGRPLDRVFSGIRPNAQGKIVLGFVPDEGMACVNGIEVVEH
jgi:hypothetical protein